MSSGLGNREAVNVLSNPSFKEVKMTDDSGLMSEQEEEKDWLSQPQTARNREGSDTVCALTED